MKLLRKPWLSALFLLFLSSGYAFCFWFISGHMEFNRLTGNGRPESARFFNLWDEFLRRGYLKYIGYAYLAISLVILLLSVLQRREYDEYQTAILKKSLMLTGFALMLLLPAYLFRILNTAAYVVDYTLLLVVVHWSAILLSVLFFTLIARR